MKNFLPTDLGAPTQHPNHAVFDLSSGICSRALLPLLSFLQMDKCNLKEGNFIFGRGNYDSVGKVKEKIKLFCIIHGNAWGEGKEKAGERLFQNFAGNLQSLKASQHGTEIVSRLLYSGNSVQFSKIHSSGQRNFK